MLARVEGGEGLAILSGPTLRMTKIGERLLVVGAREGDPVAVGAPGALGMIRRRVVVCGVGRRLESVIFGGDMGYPQLTNSNNSSTIS